MSMIAKNYRLIAQQPCHHQQVLLGQHLTISCCDEFIAIHMDLYIASHQLRILATSNKIHFKLLASKHYLQPLCPIKRSWLINIDIIKQPIILSFNPDFTGTSTDDQLMPYNWTIHNQKNKVLLNIEFLNDGQLKRAFAEIDLSQNSINI